jgi:hypothetical protein
VTTTETAHAKAVSVHTRRALTALDAVIERATLLRERLTAGEPTDGMTACSLADNVARIAAHLGALEALRDITEEGE